MKTNNTFFKILYDWGIPILVAVIVYIIITKLLFFNIKVPTSSMYPTIKPGDRIVTTVVHNVSKLKREDIIVFYSREKKERMVKRLIGLPGDVIDIKRDGSVYINGKKLNEPYVKNQIKENEIYFGIHLGKYKVPEGHYFFLGDNRANSWDSRYWKNPYIDGKDIIGKARFVFFPFSRFGRLK